MPLDEVLVCVCVCAVSREAIMTSFPAEIYAGPLLPHKPPNKAHKPKLVTLKATDTLPPTHAHRHESGHKKQH